MTRKELPPDYDLGFLCLHKDGAVTAKFRMNRLRTVRPPLEFRLDLPRGSLTIDWGETSAAGPPPIPDEDCDAFLPDFQGETSVVFSTGLEHAMASNATTGFRFHRHNGRCLLQAWRSRRQRFFVHDGTTWVETDGQDACALMKTSMRGADHADIPF